VEKITSEEEVMMHPMAVPHTLWDWLPAMAVRP
jgi:hypothetical protein